MEATLKKVLQKILVKEKMRHISTMSFLVVGHFLTFHSKCMGQLSVCVFGGGGGGKCPLKVKSERHRHQLNHLYLFELIFLAIKVYGILHGTKFKLNMHHSRLSCLGFIGMH